MEKIEEGCSEEATALAQDGPATIDVAKLRDKLDELGRAKELAKLATGVKVWGVFLIQNHNIPDSVLGGVQKVVKGIFRSSLNKRKASLESYMSKNKDGTNLFKTLYPVDEISHRVAQGEELEIWPHTPFKFR
ncbi:hypothetical protein RJ639_024114 [Escallonia herrerae]|uniref:Non-haem dioxygenase N-terminal domain-containing protein n=1 Tax=Escallonia herrerae TaxID=1293975 RepID=A0AA89ABY3_9ASTE|nr:hypothetical protein RJ639_024114 [Escallonia herrerae]